MSWQAEVMFDGNASGEVLRLDQPISFWGGVDPATGQIIDTAHPQAGESIADVVLALPGSRGSSGTPGVLGEVLRAGVGPRALLVTAPDANLLAGVLVAEALYEISCPIRLIDQVVWAQLRTGRAVEIVT